VRRSNIKLSPLRLCEDVSDMVSWLKFREIHRKTICYWFAITVYIRNRYYFLFNIEEILRFIVAMLALRSPTQGDKLAVV